MFKMYKLDIPVFRQTTPYFQIVVRYNLELLCVML